MARRSNFKTWKMGLSEDSQAWQDLLDYGRELSMQPAETARVILVEWSQARRGHMSLGGALPAQISPLAQTPVPVQREASRPKELEANIEHERAVARGVRFAGAVALDDDE